MDNGTKRTTYVNVKSFDKWKERHKTEDDGLVANTKIDQIDKNNFLKAIKIICKNYSKTHKKVYVGSSSETLELKFFDPVDGIFCQKALIHQCNTQDQYDNAITLCLHILALAKNDQELAIAENVLENFDFTQLPEGTSHGGGYYAVVPCLLGDHIVQASIQFMEKSLKTTFDKDAKNLSTELMNRFNSVYFHGTSLPALENIKKVGLSRSKRHYDRSDLDKVTEICSRVLPQAFKYYHNQPSKSIYVTNGAQVGWHFAKRSPEWLASFFENLNGNQGDKKSPFFAENRNKHAALASLENFIITHNIDQKDANKLRKFINKYWREYGDPAGAVLMIRVPTNKHQDNYSPIFNNSPDDCKNTLIPTIRAKVGHLNTAGKEITDLDFTPKDIIAVRIPFAKIKGRGIDPDLYIGE
jgi:hypothetical protein